jgi:hypothetical protein
MSRFRLTCFGALAAFFTGVLVTPVAGARPSDLPPKVSGVAVSPPPAWFRLRSRDRWLAYSSYCWKTACVDMIPPQLLPDLPRARAKLGERLTIHLAFKPRRLEIARVGDRGAARHWTLPAEQVTAWTIRTRGVLLVYAEGASGSASCAVQLVAA